jgi:hypothetical protein
VQVSVRSSTISRLGGAVIALSLCATGSARAGGGGNDTGSFQPFLDGVCELMGVNGSNSGSVGSGCPQVQTLTQIIVDLANKQNTPPTAVRSPTELSICTVAGNFGFPVCTEANAVDAVNPLGPGAVAPDLSTLSALAFFSPPTNPPANCPPVIPGQATPVPLGTNCENSFLYPVLINVNGQYVLDIRLDYLPWTSKQFVKNQPVGSFTFPLVILNSDNSQTPVVATLNLAATCSGAASCLAGTVTGIPGTGTTPPSAAQLGIQIGFQYGPSPNSTIPHGTFEFQIPVMVMQTNNPEYFGVTPPDNSNNNQPGSFTFVNQLSGLSTTFVQNNVGFTPNFLGKPVGTPPYPAPLCSDPNNCPPTPTFFGYCASIAGRPAVAGYVGIATNGTTYASSPVPGAGTLPQCPPTN